MFGSKSDRCGTLLIYVFHFYLCVVHVYIYILSVRRNAASISLPFLLLAGNGKETLSETEKKR